MILHRFKKIVLILLFAQSISSFANDTINWNGPYVGFDAGYTWGHDNNYEPPFGIQPAWSSRIKPKGGLMGINAGYDYLLSDK